MTETTLELPVEESQAGPERLTEHLADWRTHEVTVDLAEGVIANVALVGLTSKNGYRYTEQALREAVPLYESKLVFLDHARDPSKPYERSTRDLAGTIVRPRYEGDRLRADISVVDTEAGRTLLALAQKDPPGVGMSHVVLAQRSSDGAVVEKIHEVVSVDAVVFPATTVTFHEQMGETNQSELLPGSWEDISQQLDHALVEHLRLHGLESAPSAPRRIATFRDRVLVAISSADRTDQRYAVPWRLQGSTVELYDAPEPIGTSEDGVELARFAQQDNGSTVGGIALLAEGFQVRLEEQLRQLTAALEQLDRRLSKRERQEKDGPPLEFRAPTSRERAGSDTLWGDRQLESAIVEAVRDQSPGVLAGISDAAD